MSANDPQRSLANIAISSANGIAAVQRAVEILEAGGDTLEAVVSGVTIVEDDPEDNGEKSTKAETKAPPVTDEKF